VYSSYSRVSLRLKETANEQRPEHQQRTLNEWQLRCRTIQRFASWAQRRQQCCRLCNVYDLVCMSCSSRCRRRAQLLDSLCFFEPKRCTATFNWRNGFGDRVSKGSKFEAFLPRCSGTGVMAHVAASKTSSEALPVFKLQVALSART
jgi:hypothetical protein